MSLTGSVPLTRAASKAFCCVSISQSPIHQPVCLGKKLFKAAHQDLWKISTTHPEEAAISTFLSSFPFDASLQNGVLGASPDTIFFQKYSAFSKNIQLHSSALQSFCFDSNYSPSIQRADATTQLLMQLWKKNA